jgi:hypothetical protein
VLDNVGIASLVVNTATATEAVTYTALATPPPPPAAAKCVVPSVKKGSKLSTVKKLLTKANCSGPQEAQKVAATGPAATRRRALRPASVDTVSGTVRA